MECLNQMLARNARSLVDKTFLIAESESLTYSEFDRRVSQLANVFAQFGVRKGDPVGLYLPSTPLMVVAFWACQKLGAIPVPMSAMYRATELRNVVNTTRLSTMLTDDETFSRVDAIRHELPSLMCVLVDGDGRTGQPALTDLMAAAPAEFAPIICAPDDIAALFFTSGTTGVPKGTIQTQLNQYSTLRDMMSFHRTRFGAETYNCAAPLFSNLGMTVTINLCMFSGGTVVLHDRWKTDQVLDAIGRHRVTFLAGTPTMFVYMVNEFDPARHDLSSLRMCTNGGAPVSSVVAGKFEAISGAPVIQVYGATETCGQNVMEPVIGIRKPGSAGVPVGSSRIEVIDDDGNQVPHGTIGEVVIGGDTVARGYWNDPEASALVFTSTGWKSGDLGYLDDDGYLFIVDRKKDVIISGGHNIYPIEVENILYQHPDVAMCAVVGLPDDAKGEIPVAVIVLKEGRVADSQSTIEFCRIRLSAYKCPRAVFFIDEMPMGAGKIRKQELLAMVSLELPE